MAANLRALGPLGLGLVALLLLMGAACERQAEQPGSDMFTTPNGSVLVLPEGFEYIPVETATVELSTRSAVHAVRAELAETPAQRQRGLMFRTSMPEDAGMLFIFEGDQRGGFWMFNTLIPLSIAYINAQGEIIDIQDMAPCGNPDPHVSRGCPGYPAAAPYRYALEVNQGYFSERGIGVGDSVSFSRD